MRKREWVEGIVKRDRVASRGIVFFCSATMGDRPKAE